MRKLILLENKFRKCEVTVHGGDKFIAKYVKTYFDVKHHLRITNKLFMEKNILAMYQKTDFTRKQNYENTK